MYCPECGNENESTAEFCIHCGKKLPERNYISTADATEPVHNRGEVEKMSFLSNLFSRKDNRKQDDIQKRFYDKDNVGMRFDRYEQAEAYWINRIATQKFDAFLISRFNSENDAKNALLSLSCMHLAEDSGKVICTDTLYYGFFKDLDGKYNAIICGSDLSYELWENAKENFAKLGGVIKTEKAPREGTKEKPESPISLLKKINFVREDRIDGLGGEATYRIYQAPDAASAKAFLQEETVTRNLYYVVVETPEGNYCRDIQGIYKE